MSTNLLKGLFDEYDSIKDKPSTGYTTEQRYRYLFEQRYSLCSMFPLPFFSLKATLVTGEQITRHMFEVIDAVERFKRASLSEWYYMKGKYTYVSTIMERYRMCGKPIPLDMRNFTMAELGLIVYVYDHIESPKMPCNLNRTINILGWEIETPLQDKMTFSYRVSKDSIEFLYTLNDLKWFLKNGPLWILLSKDMRFKYKADKDWVEKNRHLLETSHSNQNFSF